VPIVVPEWLKGVSLIVLGVIAGSAVTPDSIAMMARWPVSLVGLAVCVGLIMVSVSVYLELVHGYDRATARLSAVPGAMPYVLALATSCAGAHAARVAIIQVVRLAALLIVLPTVLTELGLARPELAAPPRSTAAFLDIALMAAAGTATGFVFKRCGVPAAWLFGPMVGAAAITGSGLAGNALPDWLTVPGLLVMGTMVGANFADMDLRLLRDTVIAGLGSVLVGTAAGIACAIPVAYLLDLPLAQVWLAYAPGGVDTMAVVALALGLDVAFVGGHHVARFLGLGLIVPFFLRKELARTRPD